jgi:hypothetical protein
MIFSEQVKDCDKESLKAFCDNKAFNEVIDSSTHIKTYLIDTKEPRIVCIVGLYPVAQGVAQIWLHPCNIDTMRKHVLSLVKSLKLDMETYIKRLDLHRIHTTISEQDVRWIELIGLKRESVIEKFGANQENYYMYCKV